jgi:hypothetical protein
MGVPVFPKAAEKYLGKLQDKEIATRFDISPRTVSRRRKERGIPRPHRYTPLSKSEKRIVLKLASATAAMRHGISVAAARDFRASQGIKEKPASNQTKPLPKAIVSKLGKRSDAEVAQMAKLSVTTISAYRRAKGIAPYRPPQSQALTPAIIKALSSRTIQQAIDATGWSRQKVVSLRNRLGIGKASPKTRAKPKARRKVG